MNPRTTRAAACALHRRVYASELDDVGGPLWPLGHAPQHRTLLSAAALTDGRVLLSGGIRTFSYRDAHATSELISGPVSRAGGPAMSTPRFTHTSSTLPSGKVLIVGGMNAQLVPLSTAEIFE